jgi:hypothetical protein
MPRASQCPLRIPFTAAAPCEDLDNNLDMNKAPLVL